MAPPKGNRNATRHGLQGSQLPTGCAYVVRRLAALRRALESVVDASGVSQGATVQLALDHERHALLCLRWLKVEGDKLAIADRLALSREAVRSRESRNRILGTLLGGKADAGDVWAAIRGGDSDD